MLGHSIQSSTYGNKTVTIAMKSVFSLRPAAELEVATHVYGQPPVDPDSCFVLLCASEEGDISELILSGTSAEDAKEWVDDVRDARPESSRWKKGTPVRGAGGAGGAGGDGGAGSGRSAGAGGAGTAGADAGARGPAAAC